MALVEMAIRMEDTHTTYPVVRRKSLKQRFGLINKFTLHYF